MNLSNHVPVSHARRRRGTVIIMIVTLLVMIGVLAMSFLIVAHSDRRTSQGLINNERLSILLSTLDDQVSRQLEDDMWGGSSSAATPADGNGPNPFSASDLTDVADEICGNQVYERYDAPGVVEQFMSPSGGAGTYQNPVYYQDAGRNRGYHWWLRSPFIEKRGLGVANASRADYGYVTWDDVAELPDGSGGTLSGQDNWVELGRVSGTLRARYCNYITDNGGLINVNTAGRNTTDYALAQCYYPTAYQATTADEPIYIWADQNQPDVRLGWAEPRMRLAETHKLAMYRGTSFAISVGMLPPVQFIRDSGATINGDLSYQSSLDLLLSGSRMDFRRDGPSTLVDITQIDSSLERAIMSLGANGYDIGATNPPVRFDGTSGWLSKLQRIPPNGLVYDWQSEAELRYPLRTPQLAGTASANAGSRYISPLERCVNVAAPVPFGYALPNGSRRYLTCMDYKSNLRPYMRRMHNDAYLRRALRGPYPDVRASGANGCDMEALCAMQVMTNGGGYKIDINNGTALLRTFDTIAGNGATDGTDLFLRNNGSPQGWPNNPSGTNWRARFTERTSYIAVGGHTRTEAGLGIGTNSGFQANVSMTSIERVYMAVLAIMQSTGWGEKQAVQWFANLLEYSKPDYPYDPNDAQLANTGSFNTRMQTIITSTPLLHSPFSVLMFSNPMGTRQTGTGPISSWLDMQTPRRGNEDPATDSTPDLDSTLTSPLAQYPFHLPESINFTAAMGQPTQPYIKTVAVSTRDASGNESSSSRKVVDKITITLANPYPYPIQLASNDNATRPVFGIAIGHQGNPNVNPAIPRGVAWSDAIESGAIGSPVCPEPKLAAFAFISPADQSSATLATRERAVQAVAYDANGTKCTGVSNGVLTDLAPYGIPPNGTLVVTIDGNVRTQVYSRTANPAATAIWEQMLYYINGIRIASPTAAYFSVPSAVGGSNPPNMPTSIKAVQRIGASPSQPVISDIGGNGVWGDTEIYLCAFYTGVNSSNGNMSDVSYTGGESLNNTIGDMRSNLPSTVFVIDTWRPAQGASSPSSLSGTRSCIFRSAPGGSNTAAADDCLPPFKTGRSPRTTGELSRVFRYGPTLIRRMQLAVPLGSASIPNSSPFFGLPDRPMTEWQHEIFDPSGSLYNYIPAPASNPNFAAVRKATRQAQMTIDVQRRWDNSLWSDTSAWKRVDRRNLAALYNGINAVTSVDSPDNRRPGGELVEAFSVNNTGMDGMDNDGNGEVDEWGERRSDAASYPDWLTPNEWSNWWPMGGQINVNTAPYEVLKALPWPAASGFDGTQMAAQIVQERELNGPFRSTADLLERVRCNAFGGAPDDPNVANGPGFDYYAVAATNDAAGATIGKARLDASLTQPPIMQPAVTSGAFNVTNLTSNASGTWFGAYYDHPCALGMLKTSAYFKGADGNPGTSDDATGAFMDGIDERDYVFRCVGDLITVRSDVFTSYTRLQLYDDQNNDGKYVAADDTLVQERRTMSVWDRSTARPRQIARKVPGVSRWEYVPHPDYLAPRVVGKMTFQD